MQLIKTCFCLEDLKISGDEISEGKLNMFDRNTAQKMKFFIKYIFSKRDKIHSFLRILLHLLTKSLMENFMFCAVNVFT